MLDKDIKITVFTPTYNRAYILSNLYESLTRQTYKNFEWLIVDDGSTDDTESLVNGWIENESGFTINYVKQSNGGKCRAINRGLDLARGELFFTIDSDDYLTDDAVQKIMEWASELSPSLNSLLRLCVSLKNVLPPSITISPLSNKGFNCSIVASVAGPALTINIILRGTSKDCTNSSNVYVPTTFLPSVSLSISSVFSFERLKTETV